ncbi:MAG: hypothetical protein WC052_02160 [Patescibacteria group bacterium]
MEVRVLSRAPKKIADFASAIFFGEGKEGLEPGKGVGKTEVFPQRNYSNRGV